MFDGTADSSQTSNAVDRPQMMLVSRFHNVAAIQSHAQAGSKQSLLDVMSRQCVAREEDIDIAGANESANVLAAASVHDRWSTHNERPAAVLFGAEQLLSNLPNCDSFGLFCGDTAAHEFKRLVRH